MIVVRKTHTERRKISLLKVEIRTQFKEILIELVGVGSTNLWRHFKGLGFDVT